MTRAPFGHDTETEVLTQRGWRSCANIKTADRVWSLDLVTTVGAWSEITAVSPPEFVQELRVVHRRTVSSAVAATGPVLCAYYKHKDDLRYLADYPGSFHLPLSSACSADDCGLSDDWITLAGWLLTDGSITQKRVAFYQSKPDAGLEAVLSRLGLCYRLATRDRDIKVVCGKTLKKPPLTAREYHLDKVASERVLSVIPSRGTMPSWVSSLSTRQFDVLLRAIVKGDGHQYSPTSCAVYKGKDFLDSLQAAAPRHGWSSILACGKGRENDWRLHLCKRTVWSGHANIVLSRQIGPAYVWSITTPAGNYCVRRAGRVHFTASPWVLG